MPKGQYKHLPNHVRDRNDNIHAHAPVDLTPAEMHRLCEELRSEAFEDAHPVLQAAYAHYAFVVIHPFADGNGRVARALASIYMYRLHSVPLLILMDTRDEYISALEDADGKNYQSFVDFVLERALDGIQLVKESMDAAEAPRADDVIAKLQKLYVTKGGYTHEEIDQAGVSLLAAFREELQQQTRRYSNVEHVSAEVRSITVNFKSHDERYRKTIRPQNQVGLALTSAAPAHANVQWQFVLLVPRDANAEVGPMIRNITTNEVFHARVEEVSPAMGVATQIRLAMFVERSIASALAELSRNADAALKAEVNEVDPSRDACPFKREAGSRSTTSTLASESETSGGPMSLHTAIGRKATNGQ